MHKNLYISFFAKSYLVLIIIFPRIRVFAENLVGWVSCSLFPI